MAVQLLSWWKLTGFLILHPLRIPEKKFRRGAQKCRVRKKSEKRTRRLRAVMELMRKGHFDVFRMRLGILFSILPAQREYRMTLPKTLKLIGELVISLKKKKLSIIIFMRKIKAWKTILMNWRMRIQKKKERRSKRPNILIIGKIMN